jgi:hypothetical protein
MYIWALAAAVCNYRVRELCCSGVVRCGINMRAASAAAATAECCCPLHNMPAAAAAAVGTTLLCFSRPLQAPAPHACGRLSHYETATAAAAAAAAAAGTTLLCFSRPLQAPAAAVAKSLDASGEQNDTVPEMECRFFAYFCNMFVYSEVNSRCTKGSKLLSCIYIASAVAMQAQCGGMLACCLKGQQACV